MFTFYSERDALHRKRLAARRWISENPFARAMAFKMTHYFGRRLNALIEFPK
jgi:hypothetical protein